MPCSITLGANQVAGDCETFMPGGADGALPYSQQCRIACEPSYAAADDNSLIAYCAPNGPNYPITFADDICRGMHATNSG
jgi:hypothetical protein